MKIPLYFLLCLFALPASSEEMLVFPSIDLVKFSRYVVIGKPLEIRERTLGVFEVQEVLQGLKTELPDTILVHLDYFEWPSAYTGADFQAILFLIHDTDNYGRPYLPTEYIPVGNGVRLFKAGKGFGLAQFETTGGFSFYEPPDPISRDSMVQAVRDHVLRIKSIQAMLETGLPGERNRVIFDWIDGHNDWITGTTYHWDLQPLGSLCFDIFNSVINSGIPADAWKAIMKYHALFPERDWIPAGRPYWSNEEVYPAFGSPEGVLFLIKIRSDSTRSPFEKEQAALHLNAALQLDPPQWAPANPAWFKRFIGEMLVYLKPEQPDQKAAFWAVAGFSDTPEPSLRAETAELRRMQEALKTLYRAEAPGTFQNDLASYLASHIPAPEWKQLSGNDGNFCIVIEEHHFDTAQNILSFRFCFRHGMGRICSAPELVLAQDPPATPQVQLLPDLAGYCNQCGTDGTFFTYQTIQLPALSPGRWHCYIHGIGGDKNQYHWKSNTITWEIIKNK